MILSLIPEVSLYAVFYFIMDNKYVSNISFLKIGYISTIVSMGIAMVFNYSSSADHRFYSLMGYYVAKGSAAINYMIVIIVTVRYFPTIVKARAISFCFLMSRVGGLIMPYVLHHLQAMGQSYVDNSFIIISTLAFVFLFMIKDEQNKDNY